MDLFYTIKSKSEAVFTEKRSKFIAYAFPVKTVDEIKEHIDRLAKEYYDARHVCWAYMLGADRTTFRANDNGEPSGTAGKPILGQINSFELTDILIVVVRYFGGIKLGTPGLIAAYRQSARLAIENAEIIECHSTADITVIFPYITMNDVMKVARMAGVTVLSQEFDNLCSIALRVELDQLDQVSGRLSKIEGIRTCLTTNVKA